MSFQIQKKQVSKLIKEWSNLKLQNNKLMKQDKVIDQLLSEHHYFFSVF